MGNLTTAPVAQVTPSLNSPIDQVDRQILSLLTENARRSLSDVAARVNLSVAPVKRRIQRLEQAGVISGYTTVLAPGSSAAIEAFMQVRLASGAGMSATVDQLKKLPEVREVLMTAGDHDALVRLSVDDMDHLRTAVLRAREMDGIHETVTHVVLDRWQRAGSKS
ncbi:MAG: Lrp/AsnC family transcriptional regulator [Solirubrobacterales bacterium]|nr:Lrp/AsnC family transcriptional regulator [Solirubrobacterales bacterium]